MKGSFWESLQGYYDDRKKFIEEFGYVPKHPVIARMEKETVDDCPSDSE